MKKLLVGISLAACALMAADFEVSGGFGRHGVSNSTMKDYNFGNIRVGKALPKNHMLRLEVERSTSIKIPEINADTSLTRALLNVEHDFVIEDCKVTPYAFLGAGYQWVKGDYRNSPVADLGLGAKMKVTDMLSLFVEARGLRDFHNNDNHYGVLGGLLFGFGGEKPVEQPKVVDSDNDGVADTEDKCPNTPAGVKVDTNGCPVDSDNDGVADYLDKCPNTPKGFKVDKNGCAISFNFQINFDNNSAKIKPEYMEKIKEFAEFLKNHPDVKAEIQGYTDNRGSYEYNMVLSEKRAKAVYDALIKLGVSKDQITWAGYGPKNPIASNDTEEGRAKNRRVVAKIFY